MTYELGGGQKWLFSLCSRGHQRIGCSGEPHNIYPDGVTSLSRGEMQEQVAPVCSDGTTDVSGNCWRST